MLSLNSIWHQIGTLTSYQMELGHEVLEQATKAQLAVSFANRQAHLKRGILCRVGGIKKVPERLDYG